MGTNEETSRSLSVDYVNLERSNQKRVGNGQMATCIPRKLHVNAFSVLCKVRRNKTNDLPQKNGFSLKSPLFFF